MHRLYNTTLIAIPEEPNGTHDLSHRMLPDRMYVRACKCNDAGPFRNLVARNQTNFVRLGAVDVVPEHLQLGVGLECGLEHDVTVAAYVGHQCRRIMDENIKPLLRP